MVLDHNPSIVQKTLIYHVWRRILTKFEIFGKGQTRSFVFDHDTSIYKFLFIIQSVYEILPLMKNPFLAIRTPKV